MVSYNFISPESLKDCVELTDELRLLPKEHMSKEDKLEVEHALISFILVFMHTSSNPVLYISSGPVNYCSCAFWL